MADERRSTPWDLNEREFPRDHTRERQLRFLLRYAILAPSSHNSQPWQFEIRDGGVDVFADESRWLDVADADKRELYLSVGCALENLVVAASRFGFEADVDYVLDSDDALVASVDVQPPTQTPTDTHAELCVAIPERRTIHGPYRDQPVPTGVRDRLQAAIDEEHVTLRCIDDDATKRAVGELQVAADEHQFDDPAYRKELGHWIGTGALGASWLKARIGQAAVTYFNLGDREGHKNAALIEASPVVALLTTPTTGRKAQVTVGRVFERLSLVATRAGVATHPLSQILEVPAYKSALVDELELEDAVPQHLFRLGYADTTGEHTPRRPLESVLK